MEWKKDGLLLTDDAEKVDAGFVERMLRTTYWAASRSRSDIEEAARNSINFSVFSGDRQIGYARVVSDRILFAWIADVIVDPAFRNRGLGSWMIETILTHPDVKRTSQQLLRTRDAHDIYSPFGFEKAECMTRRIEKDNVKQEG